LIDFVLAAERAARLASFSVAGQQSARARNKAAGAQSNNFIPRRDFSIMLESESARLEFGLGQTARRTKQQVRRRAAVRWLEPLDATAAWPPANLNATLFSSATFFVGRREFCEHKRRAN
jgi:hypothetical protein